MKSPFLILFIIFNLLAVNIASAINIFDEDLSELHGPHTQIELMDLSDLIKPQAHINQVQIKQIEISTDNHQLTADSCLDESNCDHFCHISAHMVGIIDQNIDMTVTANALVLPIFAVRLHSLFLEPPYLPPQA